MLLTKTLLVTTVAATAIGGASVIAAGAASASPTIAGTYNAVSPIRVLDTRVGTGAAKAKVGVHATLTFSAVGSLKTQRVSAEALTVTVVSPARSGYLVAYPGGSARPATSSVNFNAGRTTANAAIVAYGASGSVSIYNGSSQAIDVVADMFGYWTGGSVADDIDGAYNPLASARLVDTRSPSAPIAAGASSAIPAAGRDGIPESNVGAVVVNVAVPIPQATGFVTATAAPDDQQDASRTSDVNFVAGQTSANLVVVPLNPDTGTFSLRNGSLKSVNAVIDVVGYFSGGTPSDDGSFVPSTPYRNSDTRTGKPIGAGVTSKVLLGVGGSPSLFKAVVATVTVVNPRRGGHLTAWSGSGARPATSAINFPAGRATAGTVVVPLASDGSFSIYNGSAGTLDVVVDVHGFMLNDLSGGTRATAGSRIRTALAHARSGAAARLAS